MIASCQEKNKPYTFKGMLLQPYKSYFILVVIKEVESHDSISHWTFIKNIEVEILHKKIYPTLKNISSIWYLSINIFPY